MSIPFVIDNQRLQMSTVLDMLFAQYKGRALDITTGSFTIGGWQLLGEGLKTLGSFRLLLSDDIETGVGRGAHEGSVNTARSLIHDPSNASMSELMFRLTEDLVAFLRQDNVHVRLSMESTLHGKSFIFYNDPGFTRIAPQVAIVGSSNVTRAGLSANNELNLILRASSSQGRMSLELLRGIMEEDERQELFHITERQRALAACIPGLLILDELTTWYRQRWSEGRDFKAQLINLINGFPERRHEHIDEPF